MADRSLIYLALVVALYSLAGDVTSLFLPSYYLQIGLSINQIIVLVAIVISLIGAFPILTLKLFPRHFERLLSVGILLYAAFYALLIFTRNPLVFGVAYGLSLAAYYPAFNLLLYRFTRIRNRGFVVTALYVVVPTLMAIVGPLVGGALIHLFAFSTLFVVGIALLLAAFAMSLRVRCEPATGGLRLPRGRLSLLFAAIIALWGFSDATGFLPFPLFLHRIAGSFLNMGIVGSAIALVFAAVALAASRAANAERHRIDFTLLALVLGAVYLIALAFVGNVPQLIGASMISGVYGAFIFLLFAIYGDFFKRSEHAMLVVLWEIFLMVGRLANLPVMGLYMNSRDFHGYFLVTGILSLSVVIPFIILKRMHSRKLIRIDSAQG